MTARFAVKNSHIENDLMLVLKKTPMYSQGYYCQTNIRPFTLSPRPLVNPPSKSFGF
jgi:hypothetical protein